MTCNLNLNSFINIIFRIFRHYSFMSFFYTIYLNCLLILKIIIFMYFHGCLENRNMILKRISTNFRHLPVTLSRILNHPLKKHFLGKKLLYKYFIQLTSQ